jgi:uncharacterized RDD family membrane protein YckC
MEWYYLRDGKTMGPVPEGSIRAWLESGFLQPEDLLWHAGMRQWLPAVELAEFGGPGEPEHAGGSNQEAPRETPGGLDSGEDGAFSTGIEPGTQPLGGLGDESSAGQVDASGSLGVGSGNLRGASPASGDGGPGGVSSAAGTAGGAYTGAGRSRPGASPWGQVRAEWSEAPAVYASVWARAFAAAIDLMLLVTAVLVVFRPELPTTGNLEDMAKLNPAITPVFMALAWLYFGLMEGSALQASLGKLAFGLKVADLEGNRLLLGRSMVRGLLKVVLMEITAFLSFLPAAFTARRQALHDIVAGSTVLVR